MAWASVRYRSVAGRSTALRACMERRGYQDERMPVGTFVELWSHFASEPLVTEAGQEIDDDRN